MIIQLSSGQGPAECELAVRKLFETLVNEYSDIKLLSAHEAREQGCYTSILFSTEEDLSELEGSIQWICRSPFRPNHKRKNWFVDVSIIPEREDISREKEIRFERFHCGGKGGQNVNKVETGVRLIHIPTGITVTSTAERSQYANKKNAMDKLNAIVNGICIGERVMLEDIDIESLIKKYMEEHTVGTNLCGDTAFNIICEIFIIMLQFKKKSQNNDILPAYRDIRKAALLGDTESEYKYVKLLLEHNYITEAFELVVDMESRIEENDEFESIRSKVIDAYAKYSYFDNQH